MSGHDAGVRVDVLETSGLGDRSYVLSDGGAAARQPSCGAIDFGGFTARRRRCSGEYREPGGEFYGRPDSGLTTATGTATVPARGDGFGGRVITGVARDDANGRLTPVALALPAPFVVEFHLEWNVRVAERFEGLPAVGSH